MTIIALDLSSLDGANGFGISGINAYDLTGMSVSGAGDFNGDGIDDVIVSSGGANAYAGISHVVFGSTAGFPASLDLSTLDGVIGFNLSGAFAGGNSGIVVSDAGDVNADGLDDVIIGAPFESDSSGSFDGRAYVVFGATSNFPNVDLSSLDGASGFAIDGAGGGFGRAVSSAGDVNGDGVADIVIGQPFNGPDNPGTAYVVYGSSSGFGASFDISALDGTNGFTISGAALLDFTGLWVSGAGDVNGDGLADIVIGAPTPPNAATSEGRAYVVFGSTAGFAANIDLSELDGSNGFAMNGIALGDGAG
ncbi:MAG: FG-GAP repeat protein, partial [Parvularculaceae bacterium]|nr:FG-GAP repeat protein [Parvularculaceae bacterium]